MKMFDAVYKCRLCGEEFVKCSTSGEESNRSFVMKIMCRAEIVWLVIRHALSWHDNPDGVAGCVSYYAPLNRSDQPQPKIELKLKGKGENHG